MKRCPKCGTVLDDDKKKCYMCGADLLRSSITQFGDSFDAQIGATISNSQDNVFNNVSNITADLSDAVGSNENDDATFTSSGADFYNNNNNASDNSGLNGLNSMQFDNRTAIEKIFSGNQRFKSKDEINAELAIQKNNKQQIPIAPPSFGKINIIDKPNNNTMNNNPMNPMGDINNDLQRTGEQPIVNNQMDNPFNLNNNDSSQDVFSGFAGVTVDKTQLNNNQEQKTDIVPPEIMPPLNNGMQNNQPPNKSNNKPKINWGDYLNNDNVRPRGNFMNKIKGIKLDVGFVVNTVCFIIFIIGVIFVYFKFIKPVDQGITSFGGLQYRINDKFILKTEESNSRYYTYGSNCALQVKFGTTSGASDFVSSYFEGVKNQYSEEDGYITQKNDLNISGNKWSELQVLQFQRNDAALGGTQTIVKYRYVSIVYKSNYYQIVYANTDNNNECSAMYDEMINSMEFN